MVPPLKFETGLFECTSHAEVPLALQTFRTDLFEIPMTLAEPVLKLVRFATLWATQCMPTSTRRVDGLGISATLSASAYLPETTGRFRRVRLLGNEIVFQRAPSIPLS